MPELLERLSAAMTNDVGHERAVVERREVLYFLHQKNKTALHGPGWENGKHTHLFKYPGMLLLGMRTPCNDESLFSFYAQTKNIFGFSSWERWRLMA